MRKPVKRPVRPRIGGGPRAKAPKNTRDLVPTATKGAITAWSFSRYSTHSGPKRGCPAKAKYSIIDKIKEPPSEPMIRGDRIHKQAEAFIKGDGKPLVPLELRGPDGEFEEYFAQRRLQRSRTKGRDVLVEQTWAFRSDWSLTTWNDWTACWLRIKTDCSFLEATKRKDNLWLVDDFKTGKYRQEDIDDYLEQIELYALGALLWIGASRGHAGLIIQPRLLYLDQGLIHDAPQAYTMDDLPQLKATWVERTRAMLNDKQFAPRPNNFCRWCHYRKENAGPCQY